MFKHCLVLTVLSVCILLLGCASFTQLQRKSHLYQGGHERPFNECPADTNKFIEEYDGSFGYCPLEKASVECCENPEICPELTGRFAAEE